LQNCVLSDKFIQQPFFERRQRCGATFRLLKSLLSLRENVHYFLLFVHVRQIKQVLPCHAANGEVRGTVC